MEGGVFWLNGLSRVLVKTEFYKEVHRQAQEKLQKPVASLVKQRIFALLTKCTFLVCLFVCFPHTKQFSVTSARYPIYQFNFDSINMNLVSYSIN